jgi:hypothetical protein
LIAASQYYIRRKLTFWVHDFFDTKNGIPAARNFGMHHRRRQPKLGQVTDTNQTSNAGSPTTGLDQQIRAIRHQREADADEDDSTPTATPASMGEVATESGPPRTRRGTHQ